jgi:predicted AlkP superfamily phosphohydrolase/phosphomutase
VEYYQLVDEALGTVLDALNPEDMLMVVSDHGFQGAPRKFHMQEYLLRHGWLQMKNKGSRQSARLLGYIKTTLRALKLRHVSLWLYRRLRHKQIMALAQENHPAILPDLDWPKTHAWIQSTSGMLAGYADILFDETVTEEQISALAAAMKEIRDPEDGRPLIAETHREDVYGAGPFAPGERHLILISNDNISLQTDLGPASLWEKRNVKAKVTTGIHHPDGILYLYGAGVRKGVTLSPTHVYDVTPTILSAMGVPLPGDLDGKVMEEPFEQPVSKSAGAQEDDIVMKKLKKLAARST